MRKISRRSFLYGGMCTSIVAGLGYSQEFEPFYLQRTQFTLDLRRVGIAQPIALGQDRRLKILHLSDLHYAPATSAEIIHEACALGLHAEPDLIFITGDLIDLHLPNVTPLQDILYRLTSRYPTFVTVGNHDGGNWAYSVGGYKDATRVTQAVREAGATVLSNSSILHNSNGKHLQIVGVGDLWSGDFYPERAFSEVDPNIPTVVLSHNPDSKTALKPYTWDLMLSGHTHGGQLRIPWVGATPFAPVVDKRFVSGLHPWDGRKIFTSTGVATSAQLRFNVRPEVTVFDLLV